MADARVARAHGCYATPLVTAVVAQSSLGVSSFFALPASVVIDQWDALLSDCTPAAIKVGMLASPDIASALAPKLAAARDNKNIPVVFDPVLRSGHNASLSADSLLDILRRDFLPNAVDVLTPNIPEAEAFLGSPITSIDAMHSAALKLLSLGPRAVLLKGGHLTNTPGDVWAENGATFFLENAHIFPGLDVHGTGCHLSTALACALVGSPASSWRQAADSARAFLTNRFHTSRWRPGKGREILGDW